MDTITTIALRMSKKRGQKSKLRKDLHELEVSIEEDELALLNLMDNAGYKSLNDKKAGSIVTTSTIRPKVEDWQSFCKFVRRHNAFELLEQRPHVTACRERMEKNRGKLLPGLSVFEKRGIRITPIKK